MHAGAGRIPVRLSLCGIETVDDVDGLERMVAMAVVAVVVVSAIARLVLRMDPFLEFVQIEATDEEAVCELDRSGKAPIEQKIVRIEVQFVRGATGWDEAVFGADGIPVFAECVCKRLSVRREIQRVVEEAEPCRHSVLAIEIVLLHQFGGIDPAHSGDAHAGIFEDGSDRRHDGLRTHGMRFDIGKGLVSHGGEAVRAGGGDG